MVHTTGRNKHKLPIQYSNWYCNYIIKLNPRLLVETHHFMSWESEIYFLPLILFLSNWTNKIKQTLESEKKNLMKYFYVCLRHLFSNNEYILCSVYHKFSNVSRLIKKKISIFVAHSNSLVKYNFLFILFFNTIMAINHNRI